jgi:GPH family glycoside/pentoside/hexuronide:cation symporter
MARGAWLTVARKVAIGAGDFGFSLCWPAAGLYLLFSHTEGLGIPAATAALISLGLILFYPLDRKTHGQMVAEITARAGLTPVPTT